MRAALCGLGAAIDRGHGRAVLAGGAVLGALGLVAWAGVREPWTLYGLWMVLGVSMAFWAAPRGLND